jgi:hypothetical protein
MGLISVFGHRAAISCSQPTTSISLNRSFGICHEKANARMKATTTRASEIIRTYLTTPSLLPCRALVGDLIGWSVMVFLHVYRMSSALPRLAIN